MTPDSQPPPKRKTGRPATGQAPVAVSIRAKPEWTAWLHATAAARGVKPVDILDQALALAAKRWKVDPPPPRT